MKKLFAESILTVIVAPVLLTILYWFTGFIISTYQVMATVNNQNEDIKEIKTDIKEVKSFLIQKGN